MDLLLKLLKLVEQIRNDFLIRATFVKQTDFGASDFEATLQLQNEVNKNCLVDQLLFGQNLLKNI